MLGWALLALVLLILATLGGALGVLQTGWGKREIASLANGALSGEGKTAEIAGIEGSPSTSGSTIANRLVEDSISGTLLRDLSS